MNIESEIRHFKDLSTIEQGRFLARFMYEMTLEARSFYSPTGTQDIDADKLRFINEIQHRITRYLEQVLIDDPARTSEDMLFRMLLTPRGEKSVESLLHAAYARTIQATA